MRMTKKTVVMPVGITELVDLSELKVRSLLSRYLPRELVYHNLRHTTAVVRHAIRICRYLEMEKAEEEIATIAAWFHDTVT